VCESVCVRVHLKALLHALCVCRGVPWCGVAVTGLQGIVTNPRTVQPAHMADNLGAFDFALTDADVAVLSALPQDWCSVDPNMCEELGRGRADGRV
jgi:hypothetical protein